MASHTRTPSPHRHSVTLITPPHHHRGANTAHWCCSNLLACCSLCSVVLRFFVAGHQPPQPPRSDQHFSRWGIQFYLQQLHRVADSVRHPNDRSRWQLPKARLSGFPRLSCVCDCGWWNVRAELSVRPVAFVQLADGWLAVVSVTSHDLCHGS